MICHSCKVVADECGPYRQLTIKCPKCCTKVSGHKATQLFRPRTVYMSKKGRNEIRRPSLRHKIRKRPLEEATEQLGEPNDFGYPFIVILYP